MPDLYEDESLEELSPEDLCRQAFSRCSNWPEDRLGQIGLAQGLYRASERFKITQQDLINRCKELSAFCPTDADLLRVAGEMFTQRKGAMEAARNQRKEWEREYGPPRAFDQPDWKSIGDNSNSRHAQLWAGLRDHFKVNNGKWPSFRDMAPIARKLGFDDYATAWERG